MKKEARNIIMITAGGIGQRYGGDCPKQYMDLLGKPVISYVIEECQKSIYADAILVVADPAYHDELKSRYGVDVAASGKELNITKRNGFDYIREHSACRKIIVLDAVRPTVTYEVLDRFFEILDRYDAVACARKITDSLGHYGEWIVNREGYYTLNAPEGFCFPLIDQYFDGNSIYTESVQQLPPSIRLYLDFDVPYFEKITYPDDYIKMEAIMRQRLNERERPEFSISKHLSFSKELLFSRGIREFLFQQEREKTVRWIDNLYQKMPDITARWSIDSFSVNQVARYGVILHCHSRIYGNVVLKIIPDFVNRFEREKEAIGILPTEYMCPLLDVDEENRIMLLRQIMPSSYATFEEYQKLMRFFGIVRDRAVRYDDRNKPRYIPFYADELKEKLCHIDEVPYLVDSIKRELEKAIALWDRVFVQAPLYIIHGDLHELNVLDDGDRLWGIDPCGFIAPLVFEYVRFIRNDIRNHPTFGYAERLDLMLHCFEGFADRRQLIAAFIIDMAFCTYNSTFENIAPDETILDLELIRIAKEKQTAIDLVM